MEWKGEGFREHTSFALDTGQSHDLLPAERLALLTCEQSGLCFAHARISSWLEGMAVIRSVFLPSMARTVVLHSCVREKRR